MAPDPVVAFHSAHGRAIDAATAGLRGALMALLVDTIPAAYGVAPYRTATADELRQAGWDPHTPAPDPLDFW